MLRQYWSNYYEKCNGLVYVIDSADEDRLAESGKELKALLGENALKGVPVLVFANKQDLVSALSPQEITETLELNSIKDRDWVVMACSAKDNDGLMDGFHWVIDNLKKNLK